MVDFCRGYEIRSCVCFQDHNEFFKAIFFQTDTQRITFERAALEYTNPNYVGPGAYVRVMRKNRKSSPGLFAFFPFLVDLEDGVIVSTRSAEYCFMCCSDLLYLGEHPSCDLLLC